MIVTREKVKTILRIPDASTDELIDTLIPIIEEQYEEIRNAPFDVDEDENTVYPKGSELTAALMVGYQLNAMRNAGGMTSESLGDYSYTRAETGGLEYPAQIIGGIRRFVGVK